MPEKHPSTIERLAKASFAGVLLSFGGLCAAVSLEACGTSEDSTGGRRVVLRTRVELSASATSTFTTALGWTVQLDEALLSVGPLYYFDGAPPLVRRSVPRKSHRGSEWAARFFGMNVAHAHPGHYQSGNALGQMLEATSVDLFAAPVTLADGEGVTGTYRSARFSFISPAVGPLANELGDSVAVASGSAEKEGEEPRRFRAVAALASVEKSAAEGHVEGCEFEETDVEGDGTVTVLVRPQVWFELVDFAELEPGTAEAPAEFPDESQPAIAFAQGLAQLSAYHFSYRPD